MIFKRVLPLILIFIIMSNLISVSGKTNADIDILSTEEFGKKVAQCIKSERVSLKNSADKQYRLIGKSKTPISNFHVNDAEIIQSKDGRFFVICDSEFSMETCLNFFSTNSQVEYIEQDKEIDVMNNASKSISSEEDSLSWGNKVLQTDMLIKGLEDKNINTEITVAVLDSGASEIDFLKDKLIQGYDFIDNDTDTSNDTHVQSHGTFLSSIIADNTYNLPIMIMPVRVVSSRSASIANVINGIYYAVDHGADVINISLGGKINDCKSIDDAIEYANDRNTAVVVCAGNDKNNTEEYCPAHINSAITVSAINSDMMFAKQYSNYGDTVDFAAPGTDINGYNASGEIITLTGTSMSAAFCSACVAIVKMLFPGKSNSEIVSCLGEVSLNMNNVSWDCFYGFGIPQMYKFSEYDNNGIELSQTNIEMEMFEKTNIVVTDKINNKEISAVLWKSNDESIASVDESGLITANGVGSTTLICTTNDGKNKAICLVTVKEKIVATSLAIFKLPNKTKYIYREDFDPEGIVAIVTYSNNSKVIVEDASLLCFSGFDLMNCGDQRIIVSYEDASASFDVQVDLTWWQWIIKIFFFGWVWY